MALASRAFLYNFIPTFYDVIRNFERRGAPLEVLGRHVVVFQMELNELCFVTKFIMNLLSDSPRSRRRLWWWFDL